MCDAGSAISRRAATEIVTVQIADPERPELWRAAARGCDRARLAPKHVVWTVNAVEQGDLLGHAAGVLPAPLDPPRPLARVAVDLLETVVRHRDRASYALAYRLLWRTRAEPQLFRIASDPDVARANAFASAVRRDAHKMRAFVRFRACRDPDGAERFVAWFEPQHHIVRLTAPFFARRFANMRWTILTPGASASWDGRDLAFGPGATHRAAPDDDELEDAWRIYYAAIFNPARLKVAAMRSEMPKKYWRNLPEAEIIDDLIRAARSRTDRMIAAAPVESRRKAAGMKTVPSPPKATTVLAATPADTVGDGGGDTRPALPASLASLYRCAAGCRRCPLYKEATQLVPGAGPTDARMMIVGEQPGDQEDIEGGPFVGPAGRVLDSALRAAQIDRQASFVTNAVKHFKFENRGKRRLHKKPSAGEIDQCRWWLDQEIALVEPEMIVVLGASAARGVLGCSVRISDVRSRVIASPAGIPAVVTVHPSFLLRIPDEERRLAEERRFVDDLSLAASHLADKTRARSP